MYEILIVDDSASIRRLLRKMLRQTGFEIGEILEAADGQAALEILKTARINLIFTDINMPNMDGLRLLRAIRSNPEWRDLPVFVISTMAGESKVRDLEELGATGFVRKPFTLEQIREKLAGLA